MGRSNLINGYLVGRGDCSVAVMVVFLLSDVVLSAVLVPVLVMALTALILIVVCARHWKNRYAVLI